MTLTDRTIRSFLPFLGKEKAAEPADLTLQPLHWLAAGVLVLAGAEAAFGRRRGRVPDEIRAAPLLAAPLAAAGHAARALYGSDDNVRTAARLLDGLAVGVGAVGTISSIVAVLQDDFHAPPWAGPRRRLARRIPSLAPLTLAATGLLGVLLDREEQRAAAVQPEAPRRRRRGRPLRVIVHV
jgi:hypothetical protein